MNDRNKESLKDASFSLKPALQTFVALVGFVCGACFVLSKTTSFHELEYEPKVILRNMLSTDSVTIDKTLQKCAISANKGDSFIKDTISQEINYRLYLLKELSDSALDKELVSGQLYIDANDFDDSSLVYFHFDTMQEKNQPILWDYYIGYSYYYNRPVTPYQIQKYITPVADTFPTYIDFFTEYPGFVLWALLIILQFTLFPVFALYAWTLVSTFRRKYADLAGWSSFVANMLLSATIIAIFVCTAYLAFFNPNLITNNLFYKNMTLTLYAVGGLTALIGVICFTGFTSISGVSFRANKTPINDEEKQYVLGLYNELNSLFINLLIISSIVLSIVVLTTGVLYTSINNMDFMQKLTSDLGYSPLAYHYVIIIAVLSSVLLLLFFVPAKLHLNELGKCIKNYDPDGKLTDQSPDYMKILQGIFVVGLPIITGIVHSFISAFINN